MLSPRRVLAVCSLPLLLAALASCGTTTVPAGAQASDPACADVVIGAPEELLGLQKQETNSQGTVAWGTGEETVVMRCGVEPPPPTSELCTTLIDSAEREVDWIVQEQDEIVTYRTYGREPAVDVSVPRATAPDQPSAGPLEVTGLVSSLPVTARCLAPGDVP